MLQFVVTGGKLMSRVHLAFSGRIARLTLTRPEARNAIDTRMLQEFEGALAQVREMPEVVVLITQGDARAFSSGTDIRELAQMTPDDAKAFEAEHARVFALLESLPQITVAAWRGYVLGGGMFLGLYHDFRVAAQRSTIGLPRLAHHWTPPWGVSRLVERIGWGAAKKLLLRGERFDGETAQALGLADAVWPEAQFDTQLQAWTDIWVTQPATALRETKALLSQMRSLDHATWEAHALEAFARCYAAPEAQAAVQNFLKRE